jgi:PBP1b-binding outer membrane lipoprotein LpoB
MPPQLGSFFRTASLNGIDSGRVMKVVSTVLTSALFVAGCSQVIDQFYSKENFDAQSFNADISKCKARNSSSVAVRVDTAQSTEPVDDTIIRECMKAKGYAVQMEAK